MTNKKQLDKKEFFSINEPKWYIVRGYSGIEHKIVEDIKKNIALYKAEDSFESFFVPSIPVEMFKQNSKIVINKSFYPGYILIKMKMNDKSWLAVTKTDRVSGFLGGSKGNPKPLSEKEYEAILSNVASGVVDSINFSNISVGSRIKVKSGSFENFEGIVKNVDEKANMLTVSVSIFDRETTIELRFDQVEAIVTKE